jgi:hypothetical protein
LLIFLVVTTISPLSIGSPDKDIGDAEPGGDTERDARASRRKGEATIAP